MLDGACWMGCAGQDVLEGACWTGRAGWGVFKGACWRGRLDGTCLTVMCCWTGCAGQGVHLQAYTVLLGTLAIKEPGCTRHCPYSRRNISCRLTVA